MVQKDNPRSQEIGAKKWASDTYSEASKEKAYEKWKNTFFSIHGLKLDGFYKFILN